MKYFIANWKMELTKQDVVSWIGDWNTFEPIQNSNVIIAPSYLHFSIVSKTEGITLASQNISLQDKGAHTGEVGAFQIKEYCNFSIVGHSERKESIDDVIKKIEICQAHEITPIVCFVNIDDAKRLYRKGCLMAWEDPENISGGAEYKPKDPAEISDTVEKIKSEIDHEMILLYGGSVNEKNILSLKDIRLLNGVLVGGASRDPNTFYKICSL